MVGRATECPHGGKACCTRQLYAGHRGMTAATSDASTSLILFLTPEHKIINTMAGPENFERSGVARAPLVVLYSWHGPNSG